jgi:hypothetical protein
MIGAETSTFVLTCAVPDDPMVDMLSVAGLVEGHAYGILDVRQVTALEALRFSFRCVSLCSPNQSPCFAFRQARTD